MPFKIEINDRDFEKIISSLIAFGERGVTKPLEKSARKVLSVLRRNVETATDIYGRALAPVKDTTQEMPIAFGGPYADRRIRGEVAKSRFAMNVTGQSSDSLSYEKKGDKEFNVGYDGDRAELIFEGNAKPSGPVTKEKRDPLGLTERVPSDSEYDAVAGEIEDAIDRLLDGF